MAKYAPPREDGLKPYIVEVWEWGKVRQSLVWANNAGGARYEAIGRTRPGIYAGIIRRATPDDMAQRATEFAEDQ